jgi:hypothetical protein
MRDRWRACAFACVCCLCGLLAPLAALADPHPPAWWEALRGEGFRLADTSSASALAREAIGLLDSTDPAIRDGIAYEALARWIYEDRLFDAQALAPLVDELEARARRGLGEAAGDGLYGRSFALLVLSVVAAADDRDALLDDARFHALVALGTGALRGERDLRGHEPGNGWGHATAHAADLLKFLARNPRLRPIEQAGIVGAIEERLRSAGLVFTWGEDARLASALAAVAARDDADPAAFLAWFARLEREANDIHHGSFDATAFTRLVAQRNALAHFETLLDAAGCTPRCEPVRAPLLHALLASR